MLTVPPLIEAKPGDPITAEGWNNIRTAVLALFDVLNKSFGTLTVAVRVKGEGTVVDDSGASGPRHFRRTAASGRSASRNLRARRSSSIRSRICCRASTISSSKHRGLRKRRARSSWTTPAAPSNSVSR